MQRLVPDLNEVVNILFLLYPSYNHSLQLIKGFIHILFGNTPLMIADELHITFLRLSYEQSWGGNLKNRDYAHDKKSSLRL